MPADKFAAELVLRIAAGVPIVYVVTHEEDIARHARRIIRIRDGLIASDECQMNSR